MSSKGYHWYNNGKNEICSFECPFGWTRGRLQVSQETREKMRQSCWTTRVSKDELKKRNEKISTTIQSRTIEEKEKYSKKISASRVGKGLGIEPWNKGKIGVQTAWNKNIPISEETRQKLKDAYDKLSQEEKDRRNRIISESNKGKEPWNRGKHYNLDSETIRNMKIKEYETRKKNNSFIKSNLEDTFYKALLEVYDKDDIVRQYKEDRYPFACDFYIKSEDLFIELHGNWTHGGRPYDENDTSCQQQLKEWQEKAKTSDYYVNAIYTWTNLDVRKREYAKKNNLNYQVIYEFN